MHIATSEHITVDPSVVEALIRASSGDLRRAITYLQSASRLSSSTSPPTPITPRDVQEIAGVVPDDIINNFATVLGIDMDQAVTGTAPKPGFTGIRSAVKEIIREGYSASQVLSQVPSFFTITCALVLTLSCGSFMISWCYIPP